MNSDDTHITDDKPEPEPSIAPDVAIDEPEAKAEFDKLANAFRRGANEAQRSAKKVIPSLKDAIGNLGYGLAYGTSYGVTFGATVASELVPNVMKDGANKGAEAGKKAAHDLMTPAEKNQVEPELDDEDYAVT